MSDNEIINKLNKAADEITNTVGGISNVRILADDFFAIYNLINRLKKENDDLFYKLEGVMHSVDKWLEGDELKQDEVNRAITMREKTLQITEKQSAEIEKLTVNMNAYGLGMKRLSEQLETAKTEAIKEFAEKVLTALDERVSENIRNRNPHWYIAKRIVRETAIEMTE